jgi:hypothetical protein
MIPAAETIETKSVEHKPASSARSLAPVFGRRYRQVMGGDYMEVHYEELVQHRREVLARIAAFIEHDLNYDRIRQAALGSLQNPNSSFRGDGRERETNTIGRWKMLFTPEQIRDIETLDGRLLQAVGYPLATPPEKLHASLAVRFMSFLYPLYFDFKIWLKSATPLARVASTGRMGVANSPTK